MSQIKQLRLHGQQRKQLYLTRQEIYVLFLSFLELSQQKLLSLRVLPRLKCVTIEF